MVTAEDHNSTSLTPEERVDQAISEARYGQAGIGSLGIGQYLDSGGGGSGGQFVFANLDELSSVLHEWEDVRNEIEKRQRTVSSIQDLCTPPADDMMSHYQADAGKRTAAEKFNHENALLAYARAYVDKLAACRNAMATTEQHNTDQFRMMGEDLGHA